MKQASIAELEERLRAASVPPVDAVRRVDALTALALELRTTDASRAHALAAEARELALERGYKLGQARATQAMVPLLAASLG